MRILNIAAGKFDPLNLRDDNVMFPKYVLNVDTSYFSETKADIVERDIEIWEEDPDRFSRVAFLNMDVFTFMERTRLHFDRVAIYRFLEHVSFTQVDYFIYLISTVTQPGALIDIIVPDYQILAEMIINEDQYINQPEFDFEPHNILLTTELLNEPSCPHASIWTKDRMKKFWHKEGRFKMIDAVRGFKFDGRGIYLRALLERIP